MLICICESRHVHVKQHATQRARSSPRSYLTHCARWPGRSRRASARIEAQLTLWVADGSRCAHLLLHSAQHTRVALALHAHWGRRPAEEREAELRASCTPQLQLEALEALELLEAQLRRLCIVNVRVRTTRVHARTIALVRGNELLQAR